LNVFTKYSLGFITYLFVLVAFGLAGEMETKKGAQIELPFSI
jgi:hypothetical protein